MTRNLSIILSGCLRSIFLQTAGLSRFTLSPLLITTQSLAGEGKDEGVIQLAPSPLSSPVEGEEGRRLGVGCDAGPAGRTALSGSQTKPPALPEMHD